MLWCVSAVEKRYRLFVYGTMLPGEREHQHLEGAEACGRVVTEPLYGLYEVGAYAALVAGGTTAVVGELYSITAAHRFRLDVYREHPRLFVRDTIQLAGGERAEAYLMNRMQIRACRRVPSGDWRGRFAPRIRGTPDTAWRRRDQRRW